MTLTKQELERFSSSLTRCMSDRAFMGRFYARFLLSSDEVQEKFADTDLKHQAGMLKASLYLVLRAAHGFEDGLEHLDLIAVQHAKRGLDIPPHLYSLWLETLIGVMHETESHYEEGLEQIWRAALQPCIDRMIAAYAL